MLRISAQFHEPGWLLQLFQGEPARFRPSAHADVEVQEAAAPLLVRHGLLPLAELPQSLPRYLGKRVDHENEDPRYYWLRHALIARPGCFEAIQALAVYLLPRWGGSLDAFELLVNGPLCATWDERLRNALRWMAVEGRLKLPQADKVQAVADWQHVFEDWSQRPLRPRERAVVLAWRGHCAAGYRATMLALCATLARAWRAMPISAPSAPWACLFAVWPS